MFINKNFHHKNHIYSMQTLHDMYGHKFDIIKLVITRISIKELGEK